MYYKIYKGMFKKTEEKISLSPQEKSLYGNHSRSQSVCDDRINAIISMPDQCWIYFWVVT